MRYLLLIILSVQVLFGQELQIINQKKDSVSFRGLSVVNSRVFWVSGSLGTIGKTTDGGKNFSWMVLKDQKKNQFRDIYAKNAQKAYIMGITQPAIILKTSDGGYNWNTVYKDIDSAAFIDALDCIKGDCMTVGDAVNKGELYLVKKQNDSWKKLHNKFETNEGEAFFAASGTNIKMWGKKGYVIVSGGKSSRILYSIEGKEGVQKLPLVQGKETTGANGMDFLYKKRVGFVVGGDFNQKDNTVGNSVRFKWDRQRQKMIFLPIKTPPKGYKSGVTYLSPKLLVSVGTSGVDYSKDGGINWIHFSDEPFHVVQRLNSKTAVMAGGKGRVALLLF